MLFFVCVRMEGGKESMFGMRREVGKAEEKWLRDEEL